MRFREDKRSGGILSVLGFGCMRFPKNLGSTDMGKTGDLVAAAVEGGINYFDTAYIYPGNEEALGAVLAKYRLRDRVFIATKLPVVLCRGPEDFDKYFNRQMERLRTDRIDYYLMHMLTDTEVWEKLCRWGIEEWLAEKKRSGRILRGGFSFHGMQDEFLRLIDAYDWDFCQIQYNYSDENFQAGVRGLKKAAAKGLPLIVMEPLLGGRLAAGLPKGAVKRFAEVNPALSPAVWGLRWLWNQEEVTVVLSGMNELSQLRENLAAADAALPGMLGEEEAEAFREVRNIINAANKIPCTGCNYCMPCPRHVNIPGCFAAYNASFSMGMIAGMHQYTTSIGVTSEYMSAPGLCVQCGACEKKCPQRIPIRPSLEAARKRMEPFWYRWGVSIMRTVLGKNRPLVGSHD
jgi:predicted aldo/keto reductase-like oxidoreductase